MGAIGSVIGGALGIGATIFGSAAASKAMKNIKSNLESRLEENQNWYDKNYNADATQRADAQRVLTMTNESIKQRNRQSAATQAVMGGTEESVAAAKAANADAYAEAASQIAVNGEARKDQIESQYRQQSNALQDSLNNLEQAKAENLKQAALGVADAGASIGGAS